MTHKSNRLMGHPLYYRLAGPLSHSVAGIVAGAGVCVFAGGAFEADEKYAMQYAAKMVTFFKCPNYFVFFLYQPDLAGRPAPGIRTPGPPGGLQAMRSC